MARNPKYTYNPCDDCKYSFSYNNQECPICKMCELKYFSAEYVAQKSEYDSEIKVWQELYADTVRKWDKAYEELEIKLENAKADVAREIFEEIEETIIKFPAMTNDGYMYFVNFDKFAELKKKYTEGE